MYKKILIILLIGTIILIKPTYVNNIKRTTKPIINTITKKISIKKATTKKESPIGVIEIPKISLVKELYSIKSPINNIEQNVTVLNEIINNNNKIELLVLAAHSGTGEKAFFKNINKLDIDDKINIIYKSKKYTYIVKRIVEQPKVGYININKTRSSQLVLTTCSKTEGKQLIIECTIK